MSKNLNYYLKKNYRIEILPISDEEGGGFIARLPQFGNMGIIGDGETVDEAIKNLEESKAIRFKRYIEEGVSIPVPEDEIDLGDYSGKFLVRISKTIHKDLAHTAKSEGISLNQLAGSILATGLERHKENKTFARILQDLDWVKENICAIKCNLESSLKLQLSFQTPDSSADAYAYSKAA